MEEKNLGQEIEKLNQEIVQLNKLVKKQVNLGLVFLRGLIAALGGTIGLAIVLALLAMILGNLNFIPQDVPNQIQELTPLR